MNFASNVMDDTYRNNVTPFCDIQLPRNCERNHKEMKRNFALWNRLQTHCTKDEMKKYDCRKIQSWIRKNEVNK